MDVFKIGALTLISLCAVVILRSLKPEWSTFIRIAAIVVLFSVAIPMISAVINYIRELISLDGGQFLDSGAFEILIKAVCIAMLTHFCASVCRDAGETGLAALSEMAGKIEIILLSFPLIKEILQTALALLRLEV